MKRILTAIVLIAAVVAILFRAPFPLLLGCSGLVAALALVEYTELANLQGARLPVWLLIPVAAPLFLMPGSHQMALVTLIALALLAWASLTATPDRVLPDAAFGIFGILWIAYPLALVAQMRRELGPQIVLFLFIVVWSGDIAALYIGKNFGRHKLAPRLSPNKTWEGAIASVAGSMLCGLALVGGGNWYNSFTGSTVLSFNQSWIELILMAVLLNVAAQIGDLVESAVKRGSGVKDSGALLPGHGGMLDRIDALLLAAPVLWYALIIKIYLGGF